MQIIVPYPVMHCIIIVINPSQTGNLKTRGRREHARTQFHTSHHVLELNNLQVNRVTLVKPAPDQPTPIHNLKEWVLSIAQIQIWYTPSTNKLGRLNQIFQFPLLLQVLYVKHSYHPLIFILHPILPIAQQKQACCEHHPQHGSRRLMLTESCL